MKYVFNPFTNKLDAIGSGGGGGVTIGTVVTGGTPDRILYVDGSGNLAISDNLTFTDSTTIVEIKGALFFDSADDTLNYLYFKDGQNAPQSGHHANEAKIRYNNSLHKFEQSVSDSARGDGWVPLGEIFPAGNQGDLQANDGSGSLEAGGINYDPLNNRLIFQNNIYANDLGFTIQGNNPPIPDVGGSISIHAGAGNGAAADGGAISITAGLSGSGATGNGGDIIAEAGAANSTDGNGGQLFLQAGVSAGTGLGGNLSLYSGDSSGASGTVGDVIIDTGNPNGGTAGTIFLATTFATLVSVGKKFNIGNPTSTGNLSFDPNESGAIPILHINQGSASADAGAISFETLGSPRAYWQAGSGGWYIGVSKTSSTAVDRLFFSNQDDQVSILGTRFGINTVMYAWPSSNTAGVLNNNGSGVLSWSAGGTVTGSGVAGRLAYWSGTSALTSSADFQVNTANAYMDISHNDNTIAVLRVRNTGNYRGSYIYSTGGDAVYGESTGSGTASIYGYNNTSDGISVQANQQTTGYAIKQLGATARNSFDSKITTYKGADTTGYGVPAIYGSDRKTGLSASQALATYTVGAADGSFLVSANILVTTATIHSFTVTCSYTDEGNTARVLTLNFSTVAGVLTPTIAAAGGTIPYEGVPLHIRAKAATTIILATTGTFTTVAYNFEEFITQIA